MWRRIIVFLGVLLFLTLHVGQTSASSYLFFAAPFFFLLAVYFFILNDFILGNLIASVLCLLLVYESIRQGELHFFGLLLLAVIALLVFWWHFRSWRQRIDDVEKQRGDVLKEKEALEERHQTRLESLKHLEERVNGLVHLFEVARDFNECLDFQGLEVILREKISKELSFARGLLVVLEASKQADKQIVYRLCFGPNLREDQTVIKCFAQECLVLLGSSLQSVRFDLVRSDEKARFEPFHVKFPLWIFPLLVERQLIAVLVIEGASVNDFQRFEILASQLALQVKKVRLYETVKETSILDGLTNVFVRRHLLERFEEELKRAVRYRFPLSVLMVDVDHFKSYNDKFGHLVGDRTLREVAQIIRENVRRVDVIGRYGGEEFLIVAPEIEKSQGFELAERIRSAVAHKHLRLYDEETQVTVSIGLSSFPSDLPDSKVKEFSSDFISILVEKADQALYRAKNEGRNQVMAYQ